MNEKEGERNWQGYRGLAFLLERVQCKGPVPDLGVLMYSMGRENDCSPSVFINCKTGTSFCVPRYASTELGSVVTTSEVGSVAHTLCPRMGHLPTGIFFQKLFFGNSHSTGVDTQHLVNFRSRYSI